MGRQSNAVNHACPAALTAAPRIASRCHAMHRGLKSDSRCCKAVWARGRQTAATSPRIDAASLVAPSLLQVVEVDVKGDGDDEGDDQGGEYEGSDDNVSGEDISDDDLGIEPASVAAPRDFASQLG